MPCRVQGSRWPHTAHGSRGRAWVRPCFAALAAPTSLAQAKRKPARCGLPCLLLHASQCCGGASPAARPPCQNKPPSQRPQTGRPERTPASALCSGLKASGTSTLPSKMSCLMHAGTGTWCAGVGPRCRVRKSRESEGQCTHPWCSPCAAIADAQGRWAPARGQRHQRLETRRQRRT